jgi:hypothetical protein
MARLSHSVELLIIRIRVIYPVILSHCSKMHNESVSISNPWYRLALMLAEDFLMKKKERKKP